MPLTGNIMNTTKQTIRLGIQLPANIVESIGDLSQDLVNVLDTCSPMGAFDFVLHDFSSIVGNRIENILSGDFDSEYFNDVILDQYHDEVLELFTCTGLRNENAVEKTVEYLSTASAFSCVITDTPEVKEMIEKIYSKNSDKHITVVLRDTDLLPDNILCATFTITDIQ
jgi:hypothetical protein